MRKHTTDNSPKDARRSPEVEGSPSRVGGNLLAEEGLVLELCAEEAARDVEVFSTDDDNALAIQKLLCDNGGKAPEQVSLSVNDNNLKTDGWIRGEVSTFSKEVMMSLKR